MKAIGRKVNFIPTGPGNPRNGEGTFARLHDGGILFAYTEFIGSDWWDHAEARISAIYSYDEGETWTAPVSIIEKNETDLNIMSPSLVRLPDGGLGMIYGRKEHLPGGGVTCMPTFSRSDDEGKTWTPGVTCSIPLGYYCPINDGAIVTRSGRILMPLSYHGACYDELGTGITAEPQTDAPANSACFACSDDSGATWDMLPAYLTYPLTGSGAVAEPGIYEHEDGTLWTWTRTCCSFQYNAHSYDGGLTWTTLEPNFLFTSPAAPMRVKKVGDFTVAIFNPRPHNCTVESDLWGRSPFACAISRDDGHSFADPGTCGNSLRAAEFAKHLSLLEDDLTENFCYASILEVKGGFLAAYYHSNGTGKVLDSTKITKIMFDELP